MKIVVVCIQTEFHFGKAYCQIFNAAAVVVSHGCSADISVVTQSSQFAEGPFTAEKSTGYLLQIGMNSEKVRVAGQTFQIDSAAVSTLRSVETSPI